LDNPDTDYALVYVQATDGNLWREWGTMQTREWVDGNVAQFQAVDGLIVYVVGNDRRLWREYSNIGVRFPIADQVTAFQVYHRDPIPDFDVADFGDQVFIQKGSTLFEIDAYNSGVSPPWFVADHVLEFQAVNTNVIYILDDYGNLWRQFWDDPSTQPIDSNVLAFHAPKHEPAFVEQLRDGKYIQVLKGVVFAEHKDGVLWREVTGAMPDKVDSKVELFQPLDDTTVYIVAGGNLFKETVNSSTPQRLAGDVWNFQVAQYGLMHPTVSGTTDPNDCGCAVCFSGNGFSPNTPYYVVLDESLVLTKKWVYPRYTIRFSDQAGHLQGYLEKGFCGEFHLGHLLLTVWNADTIDAWSNEFQ
jgi:hypothetical protein